MNFRQCCNIYYHELSKRSYKTVPLLSEIYSCRVSNHYHDFFCWLQPIRKMTLWYADIILATLWYCLSRQHKEATSSVIHKCPIAKEISQCGVALGAVQKLSHAILGLCWQRPFLCMRIIFSSLELPPLLFSQVSHAIGPPPLGAWDNFCTAP